MPILGKILYFCIVLGKRPLHTEQMHYTKITDFDVYRRWFNRQFKLSLDGKFAGLKRLGSMLELFAYKLYKRLHRAKSLRPLGDIISFSINHHSIKLYTI